MELESLTQPHPRKRLQTHLLSVEKKPNKIISKIVSNCAISTPPPKDIETCWDEVFLSKTVEIIRFYQGNRISKPCAFERHSLCLENNLV